MENEKDKSIDEIADLCLSENRILDFLSLTITMTSDINYKDSLLYKTKETIEKMIVYCYNNPPMLKYSDFYDDLYNIGSFFDNNDRRFVESLFVHRYISNKRLATQISRVKIIIDDFSYYKNAVRNYYVDKNFKEREDEDALRRLIITDYMRFFILGSYSKNTKKYNAIANEYMEIFCSPLFKDTKEIDRINTETLLSICRFMEYPQYEYDEEYVKKFKSVYMDRIL